MSLPEFLLSGVKDNGDEKVALLDGTNVSKVHSYSSLKTSTTAFASSLQHLGFGPGDVIGILSPNDINYFTAFHGIGLSGAASTTINPTYTEEEVKYQLDITEAKAIVGMFIFSRRCTTYVHRFLPCYSSCSNLLTNRFQFARISSPISNGKNSSYRQKQEFDGDIYLQ